MFQAIFLVASAMYATSLEPDVKGCNFGEIYVFSSVECPIRIANPTPYPIDLQIDPYDSGDAVVPKSMRLPAFSVGEVMTRILVDNSEGEIKKYFNVNLGVSEKQVVVRGYALSALDVLRPTIAFGKVSARAKKKEEVIELTSHELESFRILGISRRPDNVDVRIGLDERSLKAGISNNSYWGLLDDYIEILINTPHQKRARIHVTGNIEGDVAPAANPFWFGVVTKGINSSFLIPLLSSRGKDFSIGEIKIEGISATAAVSACYPERPGCEGIRVWIADDQPHGVLRGKLLIGLPDSRAELSIGLLGVVKAGRENILAGSNDDIGEVESWAPSIFNSIEQSFAMPVDENFISARNSQSRSLLDDNDRGPMLKWQVLEEGGVYGYQIFRSEKEEGPYVRLNDRTILAKNEKTATALLYKWRDGSAKIGHTYWYYVGVLYKDGRKGQLSQPQMTLVK